MKNNETTMTTTQLTGDALLAKIAEFDSTVTATAKATACGYLNESGKVDYVQFYTNLLEAKGIIAPDEEVDGGDEFRQDLVERYGEAAIEAFEEIWATEDLEYFEEAYCGEYGTGAAYAEELVNDCYGLPRELPSFVSIDWEETWNNLRYDYYEENGFIFNANW
jgi:antirestriction protein